jgi:hypothetical protein
MSPVNRHAFTHRDDLPALVDLIGTRRPPGSPGATLGHSPRPRPPPRGIPRIDARIEADAPRTRADPETPARPDGDAPRRSQMWKEGAYRLSDGTVREVLEGVYVRPSRTAACPPSWRSVPRSNTVSSPRAGSRSRKPKEGKNRHDGSPRSPERGCCETPDDQLSSTSPISTHRPQGLPRAALEPSAESLLSIAGHAAHQDDVHPVI